MSRDGLSGRVRDNDQQPRYASFGEGQGLAPIGRRTLGPSWPADGDAVRAPLTPDLPSEMERDEDDENQ